MALLDGIQRAKYWSLLSVVADWLQMVYYGVESLEAVEARTTKTGVFCVKSGTVWSL